MALMNGGDVLVRALLQEGVKWVFGIPGGQLCTFTDAIARIGVPNGMEFVMTHHEAAAAHMADAVSRTSDMVGVCTGTVGPGAVNLVTGVYAAYNDSIPMVVITPQIHSDRSYPFKGSQQQLQSTILLVARQACADAEHEPHYVGAERVVTLNSFPFQAASSLQASGPPGLHS